MILNKAQGGRIALVFFDKAPFGAKISIRAEQDLVSGTTGPVQSAEGVWVGVGVEPAEPSA